MVPTLLLCSVDSGVWTHLDGTDAVLLSAVVVHNRHVVVANVLLFLRELSVVGLTRHQRRNVKDHCILTYNYGEPYLYIMLIF